MRHFVFILLGVSTALIAAQAVAQAPPDYDITWSTIGSPGNAPASPTDYPRLASDGWGPIGSVDYTYRLSRTELTSVQWRDFVGAYTQIHPDLANDASLLGPNVHLVGGSPGHYQFAVVQGLDNVPTEVLWGYAARYCNWLCNSKSITAAAFETGAYDTSTWSPDPRFPYFGQVEHTPGAAFWIPSLNEWTKGMHYDTNRLGVGQGGYWLYPDSSDSPPVGGPPGTPGAQTGAGTYPFDPANPYRLYPVGSYPGAQSPWGLLDGSGGVMEWLEGAQPNGTKLIRGSENSDTGPNLADRLDYVNGITPEFPWAGIRIASSVPAPGSLSAFALLLARFAYRTRRSKCTAHSYCPRLPPAGDESLGEPVWHQIGPILSA